MTDKKGLSFVTNQESIQMEKTLDMKEELIVEPQTNASITLPVNGLGDATVEDVVAGKTFTSKAGVKVTGTLSSLPGELPEELETHIADKNNPHQVTAAQTGAIPTTEKGVASGVATLGTDGKVPSTQLPEMNYIKVSGETQTENLLINNTGNVNINSSTNAIVFNDEAVTIVDGSMWFGKENADGQLAITPQSIEFYKAPTASEATPVILTEGSHIKLGDINNQNPIILKGVNNPIETNDAANKAYVDSALANAGNGGGKKYATVVIGTSTAGHTAADCDYLCDGTNDEVEINNAIQSLSNGGEVKILNGYYNINNTVNIMMINNIKLTGSGISTIFNINTTNAGVRLYRITNADISHIKFVATSTSNSNCFVADETDRIKIENCWFYDFEHTIIIQSGKYHMITNNYIIMPQLSNIISIDFIGGSYSLINNNVIDTPTSNSWGVSISSDNNVVNGNIIRGMNKSIKVNGDYNIITNNHTDDCAIDNTGTNNVIENNF